MGIDTTANKYKETSKSSIFMDAQTKPVNGDRDVIKTTVNLPSFSADSVTKGVYKDHPTLKNVIKDTQAEAGRHAFNKIKQA